MTNWHVAIVVLATCRQVLQVMLTLYAFHFEDDSKVFKRNILNLLQSKFNYFHKEFLSRETSPSRKIRNCMEGSARTSPEKTFSIISLESSWKCHWNFRQSPDPQASIAFSFDAECLLPQLSLNGTIFLVRHSQKTIIFFFFSRVHPSPRFSSLIHNENEIEFFNNIIHFYYYATIFTNESSTSISSFLRFHSTARDAGARDRDGARRVAK